MSHRKYLKSGDLLQVIAPSGCLRELEAFHQGVKIWQEHGYEVEITPGFDQQWGYLAGTDDHRVQQLTKAILDSNSRGILPCRGGYGGARLLEKLARSGMSNHRPVTPKWLIGFSDITALLWNQSRLGVQGVHAPLLTTLAREPDWSIQRLFDCVEGRPLAPLQGTTWVDGQAEGHLLPANLTVATHLLGTPWQPPLENVILVLEDVTEAPYRLDRMLTHWRMMGVFQGIRGIAVGRFSRCEPTNPDAPSFTAREVLIDRLTDLGIPVIADLPCGHDGPNAALPCGVRAKIDGNQGTLSIDFTDN